MGALVIAGLGIRGVEQVTEEVRRILAQADIVFHSVANPEVRQRLTLMTKAEHDLNYLYVDGRPRIEAYRAMSSLVVEKAAAGASVVFAVYGHPCVLHTGVQLALRAAVDHALPTRILPGVSSIDGLLAATGVDFGHGGLHVLEASDMMAYGRSPCIESHVIILQVAISGARLHLKSGHRGTTSSALLDRLTTFYSAAHRALHFRLASTASDFSSLKWTTVERLPMENWTNASSLYIPPVRAVDTPMSRCSEPSSS